jgi:hypothetical protein
MAPTGAGKTDQDGRRASAGRIAHEQGSFRLSTTERERNSDESLYDYCGVQRAASPSREALDIDMHPTSVHRVALEDNNVSNTSHR